MLLVFEPATSCDCDLLHHYEAAAFQIEEGRHDTTLRGSATDYALTFGATNNNGGFHHAGENGDHLCLINYMSKEVEGGSQDDICVVRRVDTGTGRPDNVSLVYNISYDRYTIYLPKLPLPSKFQLLQ